MKPGRNLSDHWSQAERLERVVSKVREDAKGEGVVWGRAGTLAERLVSRAFHHKNLEKSLTGDWIIFKRHLHTNYYLCLASHEESNEEIYDRFAACTKREYPELNIRGRSVA